jgi:hypothetical protein
MTYSRSSAATTCFRIGVIVDAGTFAFAAVSSAA